MSRARLRALCSNPNSGRNVSETPSRMERSDAPREVAKPHLIEPPARDHLAQLALPRETPNAFYEIGVGLPIAGDDSTEQRHDMKAVQIVKWLEERCDFGGEFETKKATAGLQRTTRLGKRRIDPGNVPQAKGDGVQISALVGYRKALCIGADPFDPRQDPLVESTGASDFEHSLARVADDDTLDRGYLLGSEARESAQSDVASAPCDIEKNLTGTRLQPSDHLRLPTTVKPTANQVVHQVVAWRDAVEQGAYEKVLLSFRHTARAEVDALACQVLAHRAGR